MFGRLSKLSYIWYIIQQLKQMVMNKTTKEQLITALLHQQNMSIRNPKSIKLVSNWNSVDLLLVQKVYDSKLYVHTFIVFPDNWVSDCGKYIIPFTLKELAK